ncbi:MAG: DUF935 family protein [Ignavibacteriaceae bacterium]|nr:DUF935 family protein [Ignavibacteriaceae bacterium]
MNTGLWVNEQTFVPLDQLSDKMNLQIATRANSAHFWVSMLGVLPDPDIILGKEGNDVATYNKMEFDSHIFAELQKRKAMTTSLKLNFNRGVASEKYSKLVEDFFNSNDHELVTDRSKLIDDDEDNDLYDFIEIGLDCIGHGFQPFEILYDKINGHILPVKIIDRPREWFHFDEQNRLRFKSKNSPWQGELLPPNKFIVFRNKPRYNNPYGTRLLSRCFWPWMFKHSTEKWRIQFLEKFASVWAIGKLPRGKDNPEYQKMLNELEDMVNSGVAVIPDDGSVDLKEPAGKGSTADIFKSTIQEYNSEITKAIMTVTLLTDVGSSGGNRALGEVMERVATKVALTDKREPEKRISQLLKWIFQLNNWGAAPKAELLEAEDYDVERAERDNKLTEQGVKFTKKYYAEKYNLKNDEFNLESQNSPTPYEFAETSDNDKVKSIINSLTDTQLQSAINPIVKPVLNAFKESSNFQEAMEKIMILIPDVRTDAVEDLIIKLNAVGLAEGSTYNQ